jgi:hypothetical protein
MALIEMRADLIETNVWWLWWVDRNEIVGRNDQESSGTVRVTPQGPHWSPMKSVGGRLTALYRPFVRFSSISSDDEEWLKFLQP